MKNSTRIDDRRIPTMERNESKSTYQFIFIGALNRISFFLRLVFSLTFVCSFFFHIILACARTALSLALIQIKVCASKDETIASAIRLIRDAVHTYRARVVALPEAFCNPYVVARCTEFSEWIPSGDASVALSNIAKELKIYVVGGTIAERNAIDASILYNTCTVWAPDGSLIAQHRKVQMKCSHSIINSSKSISKS